MLSWAGDFRRDLFGTQVFISYANDPAPAQATEPNADPQARLDAADPMHRLAERVALAIRERGFKAFFDKHDLQGGQAFGTRIQRELEKSSLFVFLITAKAVADENYTLTEVKLAMGKWPNPSGRILPVMVRKTDIETVPQYLKAVHILTPAGDVATEVGNDVSKLIGRIRRKRLFGLAGVIGALLLVTGATGAYFGLLGGTFRIYDGYVLNDAGEVKARDEVQGFENCQSFCQRDEDCNAFSFSPNGTCTLTRTYEQIVPRAGGRFGVRATRPQPQINLPRL